MRRLRYAVALVVVVDFLVAVVQMQQAIIERASFQRPSVTTFGQYAVTMTSKTSDDVDLYVRDPQGDIGWYGSLQAGALSLEHDTVPGVTDPAKSGEHELMVIREAAPGEYVANVQVYNGRARAAVTVQLWDLRGLHKRMVLSRTFAVQGAGQQTTAFRWQLNRAGAYVGHNLLPADLRGLHKRMVLSRTFAVQGAGQQTTAFRWQLNSAGAYVGHNLLPADLLRQAARKK